MKLSVRGLTYYLDIASHKKLRPTLLMMHGFMGSTRVFDHLIEPMSKFCKPVRVDLLGHGRSEKVTDENRYREEEQIADIVEIVHQSSPGPFFLYGYSMGGRLALKMALAQPGLFKGLILESTTCGIADDEKRALRRQADSLRAEEITTDFDSFLNHWQQLPLFSSPLSTDENLQQKYTDIQKEQSPEAIAASLRGFGTGSMEPCCSELSSFPLPVLLLSGSADAKYQQINHDLMKRFPNATFSSIEAGHRIHLDNPTALLAEMSHYFSSHNKA